MYGRKCGVYVCKMYVYASCVDVMYLICVVCIWYACCVYVYAVYDGCVYMLCATVCIVSMLFVCYGTCMLCCEYAMCICLCMGCVIYDSVVLVSEQVAWDVEAAIA